MRNLPFFLSLSGTCTWSADKNVKHFLMLMFAIKMLNDSSRGRALIGTEATPRSIADWTWNDSSSTRDDFRLSATFAGNFFGTMMLFGNMRIHSDVHIGGVYAVGDQTSMMLAICTPKSHLHREYSLRSCTSGAIHWRFYS